MIPIYPSFTESNLVNNNDRNPNMVNRNNDGRYQAEFPGNSHVFYLGGERVLPIIQNQNFSNNSFGKQKKRLLTISTLLLFVNAVATILIPLIIISFHNYFLHVIDFKEYLELILLLFLSGALSLFSGWLSTFLRKQNNRSISISLAVFFLCMFLLILTISNILHMVESYETQIKFDWYPTAAWSKNIIIEHNSYRPHLRPGTFHTILNSTLFDLQTQYGLDKRKSMVWDRIQRDLKCCGVNGPYDYNGIEDGPLGLSASKVYNVKYPLSCYSYGNVEHYMMPFANGCLDNIAYNYYLSLTLLFSANVTSFVIHTFVVIFFGFCYFTK